MTLTNEKIEGLILLGGKSTRMGQPKAHLVINHQPQWRRCLTSLTPFCKQVYLSVSPHLKEVPPVADTLLIHDIFCEPIGPLGALISAFKRNNASSYFVLACDLPFFGDEAVQYLLNSRDPNKYATVYMDSQGQAEPLCGVYEPKIFAKLMQAWMNGQYCPRRLLETLDIQKIAPKYESWLSNINHFSEYQKLESVPPILATKEVLVSYYAAMREATGKNHERINTEAKTVEELFLSIKKRYQLALPVEQMRFAKNSTLVLAHEPIFNQDSIVFIPPVSGG